MNLSANKYRVGLIGAGYVSKFHLLALRRLENIEIVGVCDLDRAKAEATGCRAFATTAELYAAGADAVHVLTPPASHAALTLEALAHGCHVLVEKPLATSVEDCDRIAAAAAAAGKVVCVNHSLLRDPFILEALQLVRQGAVGEILTVDYFRSSDYPPYLGGPLPPQYRDGGYPFRDLGVHALYLLQAFLGDIQEVQGQFRNSEETASSPRQLPQRDDRLQTAYIRPAEQTGSRKPEAGSADRIEVGGQKSEASPLPTANCQLSTAFPSSLPTVDCQPSTASASSVSSVSSVVGFRKSDPLLHFDEWRALVRCARGTGQIQLSWNIKPIQNQLFIQGTKGTIRVDLFSMFVATRRNTPFPKAIERVLNGRGEGKAIRRQVGRNVIRFLRGQLMSYHGLQDFVRDFYRHLAEASAPDCSHAALPACRATINVASEERGDRAPRLQPPATLAEARQVVDWTERVARPADDAKRRWQEQTRVPLTASVLVTGANGFIGRHLLARLLESHPKVRVLVRRPLPADPRLEMVLGDLGDPEVVDRAVAGTELIYHVGATMSGAREDFERGTVVGTQNILEAMRRHGVGKLVYVSSLSVLHAAAAQQGVPMREDWPLEPRATERGAYTQTKLAAENMVRAATDLKTVILRPGQVFGPGAPLLTPAVARRVKGKLVILGNGRLVLPLVYVEDVVDAILLASQKEAGLFQIVDQAQVTQRELAAKFGPTLTVPLPVVYTLALSFELLGKLLKRPVPLTRYRLKSALAPINFDCRHAREVLGWTPRVGVAEGLRRTLAEPGGR